jgi:hypothetical protein
LDIILRGISERASNGGVTVNEMSSLQSLMVKLLSHFECLEDVFCLVYSSNILLHTIIFVSFLLFINLKT